jgi:hypothetical protein
MSIAGVSTLPTHQKDGSYVIAFTCILLLIKKCRQACAAGFYGKRKKKLNTLRFG